VAAYGAAVSLGWTLNYEMFFYLIFGIVLIIRHPAGRLVAITLTLGALAAAGFSWHPANPILQTYSSVLLLEFLSGTLLGAASQRLMVWGARIAGPLLGVAALCLVAAYYDKFSGYDFLLFGLPPVLTVAGMHPLKPYFLGLQKPPATPPIPSISLTRSRCAPYIWRYRPSRPPPIRLSAYFA